MGLGGGVPARRSRPVSGVCAALAACRGGRRGQWHASEGGDRLGGTGAAARPHGQTAQGGGLRAARRCRRSAEGARPPHPSAIAWPPPGSRCGCSPMAASTRPSPPPVTTPGRRAPSPPPSGRRWTPWPPRSRRTPTACRNRSATAADRQPAALVRQFCDAVADDLVRTPAVSLAVGALPYAWREVRAVPALREWSEILTAALTAEVGVSLRVDLPEGRRRQFRAVLQSHAGGILSTPRPGGTAVERAGRGRAAARSACRDRDAARAAPRCSVSGPRCSGC